MDTLQNMAGEVVVNRQWRLFTLSTQNSHSHDKKIAMRAAALLIAIAIALCALLVSVDARPKGQKGVKLVFRGNSEFKDFHCGGIRKRHSLAK